MTTEDYLRDLAASMGIEDPPEVAVIRPISPEESVLQRNTCMTEAGWVPGTDPNGETYFEYPNDQEEAFSLAQYICHAQYPIAERYLQPPTRADLERRYTHYRDSYVPCLEKHGFEVPEMPTLEAFLADPKTWQPLDFEQVLDAIEEGRIHSFEEFDKTCPANPE